MYARNKTDCPTERGWVLDSHCERNPTHIQIVSRNGKGGSLNPIFKEHWPPESVFLIGRLEQAIAKHKKAVMAQESEASPWACDLELWSVLKEDKMT